MRLRRPLLLAAVLVTACAARVRPGTPRAVSVGHPDWSPVSRFLDSVIASGAAPGAVLGVSVKGQRFYHSAGRLGLDDARTPDRRTVYDLASLTKILSLTTLAMFAVEEGKLDLDAPVGRYVPAFTGGARARITVRMLLAHAGGLPAWLPLYRNAESRAGLMAAVDTTALVSEPGAKEAYSDLGIIVLTQAIEGIYGERLDTLAQSKVFDRVGMPSTRYLPPVSWRDRIAPTEQDPWRGRMLRGEVHDENAARMDGVSGHAGLFSDAEDMLAFGEWTLTRADAPATAEFIRPAGIVAGSSRALGWDTPSAGSSAGTRLSASSIGHTGFTGTSLWIDPERRLVIVLLSNRVHPTRENTRWPPVRARVADLVMTTLFEDAR
ncbi:MAG: beta-lactamase family protein [Gemmatimonadales bacterium]|nr:beta-lactamase family protein [Gemmatimonadales bacterium]